MIPLLPPIPGTIGLIVLFEVFVTSSEVTRMGDSSGCVCDDMNM